MAANRNTGTRIRYDADDLLWHAKVRVVQLDSDGEKFLEYLGKFATLLELVAWFIAIFDGLAAPVGNTVAGHPDGPLEVGPKP